MSSEENIYAGIRAVTGAQPERRFRVTIGGDIEGRGGLHVGFFQTLEAAITARDQYQPEHRTKQPQARTQQKKNLNERYYRYAQEYQEESASY